MGDWKRLCNGPHAALTSQWVPLLIFFFLVGIFVGNNPAQTPPPPPITTDEASAIKPGSCRWPACDSQDRPGPVFTVSVPVELRKQSGGRRYVTELQTVHAVEATCERCLLNKSPLKAGFK